MIERLAIGLAALGLVLAVGALARGAWRIRMNRVLATVALAPTGGAPRLLLFTGPGCSACLRQKQIIDQVAAEWPALVEIEYVDAAKSPQRARQFGVMMVPTTVVTRPDGRIAEISSGLLPADRLLTQLAAC